MVWNKGLKGDEYKKHYKNKMGNPKGKTYEDLYGREKANKIKKLQSNARIGQKRSEISKKNQSKRILEIYNSGVAKFGFKKGYTPINKKYFDNRNLYRKIAFQSLSHKCSRCGYNQIKFLIVHHKDWNRLNNKLSNLEILCRNCHWEEHH